MNSKMSTVVPISKRTLDDELESIDGSLDKNIPNSTEGGHIQTQQHNDLQALNVAEPKNNKSYSEKGDESSQSNVIHVAPIMNDYKWSFFKRRLVQTFLGGLRLYTEFRQPVLVYIVQLLLFILPLVATLPFVLTAQFDLYPHIAIPIASSGIFSLIITFILNLTGLIAHFIIANKNSKEGGMLSGAVEKEETVDKVFSVQFLTFIFQKTGAVRLTANSVVSGLLASGVVWTMRPSQLQKSFVNYEFSWIFFAIQWISYLLVVYSLNVRAPAEPCQLYSQEILLENSRPFYLALSILFDILSEVVIYYEPSSQWSKYVAASFLSLYFISPLLLSLGLLPSPWTCCMWFLEIVNVYVQGGSASASDLRLIIMSMESWIGVLGVFFCYLYASSSFATFLALGLGFLLSQDSLVSIVEEPLLFLKRKVMREKDNSEEVHTRKILRKSKLFSHISLLLVGIVILLGTSGAGASLYVYLLNLPSSK